MTRRESIFETVLNRLDDLGIEPVLDEEARKLLISINKYCDYCQKISPRKRPNAQRYPRGQDIQTTRQAKAQREIPSVGA